MDEPASNYHREFFKSPQHAALGLLTLGLGFLSAQLLGLIVGVTAYVLGWIYLPDMAFFRRWVDRRQDNAKHAEEAQKVADFIQRRDGLLRSLAPQCRERYARLSQVCRDIETATADNLLASADPTTDPRLRKLDELMWTYLRLLGIEQTLDQQIKLIRADAVATKNAETLTARIDATVEHLDQTNKWLSELDEFKDLVGDMPPTELRVGYQPTLPTPVPPVIDPNQVRRRD